MNYQPQLVDMVNILLFTRFHTCQVARSSKAASRRFMVPKNGWNKPPENIKFPALKVGPKVPQFLEKNHATQPRPTRILLLFYFGAYFYHNPKIGGWSWPLWKIPTPGCFSKRCWSTRHLMDVGFMGGMTPPGNTLKPSSFEWMEMVIWTNHLLVGGFNPFEKY